MKIVYEGGVTGYIEVPHLDFYPEQTKGWLSPLFWLKYIELSRQILTKPIVEASQDKSKGNLVNNFTIFVIRQQLHFTENLKPFMENLSKSSSDEYKGMLRFIHVTSKIKKSSAIYNLEVRESVSGKLILYSKIVVVKVGPDRKASPFPDQFRRFVADHHVPNPIIDEMEILHVCRTIPPNVGVFKWSRKLTLFDTDYNGHSNNSAYFLLPFDCLARAIEERFTTSLTKDLNESLIDKFTIEMVKETKEGDIMKVVMWEGLPLNFNFILSVDSKNVAYLKLIFQPQE